MNLESIIQSINKLFDKIKTPAEVLPPFLLKCTTETRPGLSAYKTTTNIISDLQKLGINTGPNPDGTDNVINQYTYAVVKNIYDSLKKDAVVHGLIGSNSLFIQATGGNAGGPIVANGSNILDTITKGIIT